MSKSLEQSYRKSVEERWSMRFRTRHPEGDNYDGVIVHIGQHFIVVREEIDFEFDGIVVLPKKVIRGVRDGEFERCANKILETKRGAFASQGAIVGCAMRDDEGRVDNSDERGHMARYRDAL